MNISFRASTLAALFAGLSIGLVLGSVGAQQIAKNWPDKQNLFNYLIRFPAPEPLKFGKLVDGTTVLCDKKKNAYSLVNYNDDSDPKIPHRAWDGFQELNRLYQPFKDAGTESDSTSLKPAIPLMCE